MPVIYGDERDVIIAKWNQIQAFWGTGKGYFNQQQAVEFNAENPFCRFKVRHVRSREFMSVFYGKMQAYTP